MRRLWWTVHEPGAPELKPDAALERIFAWGHRVGELAQERFPGGVLVPHEPWKFALRVVATREALACGAPALFEATFQERGAYGAIDVLERCGSGWTLVEVKSTVEPKAAHVPDVAIQLFVARAAGLDVRHAEVMHLNRSCRAPDLSNLFARSDVTELAEDFQLAIPGHLSRMHAALAAPEPPPIAPGVDCEAPNPCPFQARCWPELPEHHVSTLYRIGRRRLDELLAAGIVTVDAIPEAEDLADRPRRQVLSVRENRVVIEPGLPAALRELTPPVAYLDFETVAPPVPVWEGCGPYDAVPVQMSCHVVQRDGAIVHHAYLADTGGDPRLAMADAVVAACASARTVVAYNAPFEARCIMKLGDAVRPRARQLLEVRDRLVDLLPIVADHVYHPAFHGSFSIKSVLPALVPGLGYDDLAVADGGTASALLEALLLEPAAIAPNQRAAIRERLLAYCERDTLAMVKLVDRLNALAASQSNFHPQ
jgi:predicted RecB family nuclease